MSNSNCVENWSYDDVGDWLKCVGLGTYAALFCRQEITGEILLTMTERDILTPPMNIDKFGVVRKFSMELEKLKLENKIRGVSSASAKTEDSPSTATTAEVPPPIVTRYVSTVTLATAPTVAAAATVTTANAKATISPSGAVAPVAVVTTTPDTVTMATTPIGAAGYYDMVITAEALAAATVPSDTAAATVTMAIAPTVSAEATLTVVTMAASDAADEVVQTEESFIVAESNVEDDGQMSEILKDILLRSVKTQTVDAWAEANSDLDANKNELLRGYGFGGFSEAALAQQQQDVPIMPAVMVKGTYMDSVIKMEEKLPDFCWRFQDNNEMIKQMSGNNPILGDLVFVVSPVEFYIQPQFYMKRAMELRNSMNDFYSDDLESIPCDEIYENMPCAVQYKDDMQFYRAVVQQRGVVDARVFFIDWGDGQFVTFDAIKPLTNEFGRYPPLTFRCRIKGVRERSLVQEIVETFKSEVATLPDMTTKFTVVSHADNVVTVRLFHPETGEDIGKKYVTTEPLVPPFNKVVLQNGQEEDDDEEPVSSGNIENNDHSQLSGFEEMDLLFKE